MKFACKTLPLLLLCATAFPQTVPPQNPLAKFKHVVVIFQENRTPDNLFQGLPAGAGYDISSTFTDPSGHQQPLAPVPFANNWDLDHSHNNPASGFEFELNNPGVPVKPSCGANTFACALNAWNQFMFVENTTVHANGVTQGVLQPYLDLATQYGWGNRMFQTNQGPSYPAHQFIFSGTSALNAGDDGFSTFVSENFGNGKDAGCLADSGETNSIISPNPSGVCPDPPPPGFTSCTCSNNNTVKECALPNTGFTYCVGHNKPGHQSMVDLLPAGVNWKYYAPSDGSIWTAPDAFDSICVPVTDPVTGDINCSGSAFKNNVVLNPPQIFTDIASCNLAGVTWVIPDGRWSDHANVGAGLGPSWVASIVNTIGQNPACPNLNNEVYWQDTAIIITWDDWGGWFDHVQPAILTPGPPCTSTNCPGDYQYGFRVPLIVVSAYTPPGYINNMTHDFGTILRMIEGTFSLGEGSLGFADFRANTDLSGFFSLTTARSFTPITTIEGPNFFLTLPGAPVAPDSD